MERRQSSPPYTNRVKQGKKRGERWFTVLLTTIYSWCLQGKPCNSSAKTPFEHYVWLLGGDYGSLACEKAVARGPLLLCRAPGTAIAIEIYINKEPHITEGVLNPREWNCPWQKKKKVPESFMTWAWRKQLSDAGWLSSLCFAWKFLGAADWLLGCHRLWRWSLT